MQLELGKRCYSELYWTDSIQFHDRSWQVSGELGRDVEMGPSVSLLVVDGLEWDRSFFEPWPCLLNQVGTYIYIYLIKEEVSYLQ